MTMTLNTAIPSFNKLVMMYHQTMFGRKRIITSEVIAGILIF